MSYTKIWLHCVWSIRFKEHQITKSFRPVFLAYFMEMANENGILLDSVNVHKDHVHALISLGRYQNIDKIIKELQSKSADWINGMKMLSEGFDWHDEYFAVSVSQSQVERVRSYIKNQDEHHKKQSWESEAGLFVEKYAFELKKD